MSHSQSRVIMMLAGFLQYLRCIKAYFSTLLQKTSWLINKNRQSKFGKIFSDHSFKHVPNLSWLYFDFRSTRYCNSELFYIKRQEIYKISIRLIGCINNRHVQASLLFKLFVDFGFTHRFKQIIYIQILFFFDFFGNIIFIYKGFNF